MTGKPEQADFLRELGAGRILSREEAQDQSARLLLKGRWAGVIDTVGGSILATAIKSCRYNGVVTCCGNAASPNLPLNVYPFILRGVSLLGIDSAECPMAVRHTIWARLAEQWRLPNLAAMVTEISLDGLPARIEDMLQGRHHGRTLVNLNH